MFRILMVTMATMLLLLAGTKAQHKASLQNVTTIDIQEAGEMSMRILFRQYPALKRKKEEVSSQDPFPQAASMVLSVNPDLPVVNGTDITIDCRISQHIEDFESVAWFHVEFDDTQGNNVLLASTKGVGNPSVRADGRTSAKAEVQTEKYTGPSYLTVYIRDATFEDEGIYRCLFLYISKEKHESESFRSEVNVTVEMASPSVHNNLKTFTKFDGCNCSGVWEEINIMKDEMMKKGISLGSGDGTCQVSFSANFKTQHGNPIMNGRHLIFNEVISNKGHAYCNEKGVFTAPCDGQYFFTLSLRSHQEMDSGYVDGRILAGEDEVARTSVFVDSPINNIESASNSVVVTLKKDQEVKVMLKTTSFGQIMGSTFSIFSGFYLFP